MKVEVEMVVICEDIKELTVMRAIVKEFESTPFYKSLDDDSVFSSVLTMIKKEFNIQKYTALGYETRFVKCDDCGISWQALHPKGQTYIECPNCKYVIEFKEMKKKI